MKKQTTVLVTAAAGIAVLGITLYIGLHRPPPETADMPPVSAESEGTAGEVIVSIHPAVDVPKAYEEIVDEETGETVMAEVQENVPPQPKPTAPPEKPKANGCYTNPEAPPTYTEEQTVITEEAKQPISQSTNQTGENDGKAYVEGFGYVDVGGSTKSVTGASDGDINKMVGVMD